MRAGRGREGGVRPVRAGPVCALRAHLLQLRSRGLRPVRPRGVSAGVGAGPPRGSECGPGGGASSSSCLPQLLGRQTRKEPTAHLPASRGRDRPGALPCVMNS